MTGHTVRYSAEDMERTIARVCGISMRTADDLIGQLTESADGTVSFRTRNELLGDPIRSEVVHHWELSLNVGPRGGVSYTLEHFDAH